MISHWRVLAAALALAASVAVLALLAGTEVGGFGGLRFVLAFVNEVQRRLYGELAWALDELKSGGRLWPLAALFGVSFLYGVLHAVGPGHGKIVISSYLVASGSQFRRGLALSFAAAMVQAVSAILLVGLLAVALKLSRLQVNNQGLLLQEGSYGLIVAVGLAMLIAVLRRAWGMARAHGHGDHHGHGGGPAAGSTRSWRGWLAVALATGIRPCSGAILVLLFALAQGMFVIGMAATVVMAVGTGVTVSALALLAVYSRRTAMRIAGESSEWQARIHNGLALLGALLVIGAGLLLLVATAGQTSSI